MDATNWETLMQVLKGNIGPGVLAMPMAMSKSGLMVGLFSIPILGLICTHCMHMLVKSHQTLCSKFGDKNLDFEEIAEKAFLVGPKCFRKYAEHMRRLVSFFLVITQLGICCVYIIFISSNIGQAVQDLTSSDNCLDIEKLMLIMCPLVLILVNSVTNLKHIAISSTCANIIQAVGLLVVASVITRDLPKTWSVPYAKDYTELPLFFGTAIYAFEGIGIILPLRKEMKESLAFDGMCGILSLGMTIVTCLFTFVGFFGYLKFGDEVSGSITLNLPKSPLYDVIRLMFGVAIYLTYPLQMYVAFVITDAWVQSMVDTSREWCKMLTTFLVRNGLVILTFSLAALIPKLDLFISLAGAVSSTLLALILPPLLQLFAVWEDDLSTTQRTFMWTKNVCIVGVGFFGCFTGAYSSLTAIVNAF